MEETAVVAKPKEWWLSTREFWRDTSSEMRKVTWPGRQEVVNTTLVVLVAVMIFGVFLWGCDVVFFKLIDILFSHFGAAA